MVLVHDTLSHLCATSVLSFNQIALTVFNLQRTQNCIFFRYKGDNLKNIYARVMVLVHDTSSQCALQIYEVSLKYL